MYFLLKVKLPGCYMVSVSCNQLYSRAKNGREESSTTSQSVVLQWGTLKGASRVTETHQSAAMTFTVRSQVFCSVKQ